MSLLDSHAADGLGLVLDSALLRHGDKVDHPAPGVWRAADDAGRPFVVEAADGWLTIHGAAPEDVARQPPSTLLGYTSALSGHAKVVPGVQDDDIFLRAELPLDAEADVAAQVPAVVAAFAGREKDIAEVSAGTGEGSDSLRAASLSERCAETGWPAVERPNGELAVELEVPAGFMQATVRQGQGGGWCVDVPLVSGEPATATCREATARLLLRVSRLVRLVRAALVPAPTEALPGLRVWLPPAASSNALGHAFAALSVACRLCGREAAVLWHDDRVARVYIERALPG